MQCNCGKIPLNSSPPTYLISWRYVVSAPFHMLRSCLFFFKYRILSLIYTIIHTHTSANTDTHLHTHTNTHILTYIHTKTDKEQTCTRTHSKYKCFHIWLQIKAHTQTTTQIHLQTRKHKHRQLIDFTKLTHFSL